MNRKIKNRITRKVARQLLGSFPVEVMTFSYADIDPYIWGWPDWTLD